MNFVYLVQGQACRVRNFFHLGERENASALFLTYDERLPEAIFFPQSTWAEGRNRLLAAVQERGIDYDYLVFVDDDTHFYLGDWAAFEQGLKAYKPAIGVPVFDRTVNTVLPYPMFPVQSFTYNDEQLMAFSREVVAERKILPYQTQFDTLHWWATCRLQQILIQNFYADEVLQINTARVANLETRRYPVKTVSDEAFKGPVLAWVRQQYGQHCRDVDKSPARQLLLLRTLRVLVRKGLLFTLLNPVNIGRTWKKLSNKRREVSLERLAVQIDPHCEWVLYGFGDVGRKVYEHVRANTQDINLTVVDKAALNQSYQVDEVQVLSPQTLVNRDGIRIIVATFSFKEEIEAYLIDQLGLSRQQLLFLKSLALENEYDASCDYAV